MQYLLLIYADEQHGPTESERAECYEKSARFAQELDARGKYVAAAPLQPTTTATSVRMRDGRQVITDGPFAETREQLGGFFLVDANDLDEAIGIAAQIPASRWGTVEVRPVIAVEGLPSNRFAHPVDSAHSCSTREMEEQTACK
jgi:hypothetical protein